MNLIGVAAAECEPPAPGKAYRDEPSFNFELVDESEIRLQCSMLEHESFPWPSCGDVLCLRKVVTEHREGKLFVKTFPNTAWLLFRKVEGFKPYVNFHNVSFGAIEANRLSGLKTWAARQGENCPLGRLTYSSMLYLQILLKGLPNDHV